MPARTGASVAGAAAGVVAAGAVLLAHRYAAGWAAENSPSPAAALLRSSLSDLRRGAPGARPPPPRPRPLASGLAQAPGRRRGARAGMGSRVGRPLQAGRPGPDRAEVSGALHLPRRPQQPAAGEARARPRDLPLQSFPDGSDQVLHAPRRSLHPSLPATCPPQRLRQSPLLWSLCPRRSSSAGDPATSTPPIPGTNSWHLLWLYYRND